MGNTSTKTSDRRRSIRLEPPGLMLVSVAQGGESVPDAEILNMSEGGAAIRVPRVLVPGDRVAFNVGGGRPPVTCSVIECSSQSDGWFVARCKCILGGFDL
ncbi:MAG: PilZ domain-containing protein [Phycisphaeraceae bacterium]